LRRADALFWFGFLLLSALSTAPAASSPRRLTGPGIRSVFIGRQFGDGPHFLWTYKRDGRIEGVSLGKRITGTWRVLGDQLCERRGAETCFDVDKDGEKVTLTQDGTDITTTGYLRQLGRPPRGRFIRRHLTLSTSAPGLARVEMTALG